ncbi:MAG: IS200/IS605 family transposase, partial [Deltaproteobacteria bacterium]|nr:IS200/IS605 family transposase [Deltaproteobacteria bacterium]MBW2166520.1 IS200/IS605 family transposase [Deltaproteobacteria bacterium]
MVFVPKYRYRILKGSIGKFVYKSIYAHTERSGCE